MSEEDKNAAENEETKTVAETEGAAKPEEKTEEPPEGTDKKTPAEGGETSEEDVKPKEKPWFQKRFDKLTSERAAATARADQLAAQNAELLEKLSKGETLSGKEQKDFDAQVEQRAAQRVQQEKFNEACNGIFDKGVEEFGDFKEALNNLSLVGATGKDANPAFLAAITELDGAHKVLHHLGKNPELAEKIISMSPAKMAIELSRVEAGLSKPKEKAVSKAPEPIKPLGGTAKNTVSLSDDKVDMDRWLEERNKQLEARKNRR